MGNNTGKKRADVWREQYQRRRYLQYVNEEELGQRLRDIINNSIILTEKGQCASRLHSEGGGYWMMKLTHIHEEYLLRECDVPDDVLKDINLPKFTYPEAPKSALKVKGKDLVPGEYLIKYGKVEHLKKIVEEGIIRIAPASSYNDPSLNYAIRDDELTLRTYGLPQEVKMAVKDNKTGEEKGPLVPTSNITYSSECKTDYYIFCLSMIYDYRLFDDFDKAEGCIIINKPGDFLHRIKCTAPQVLSEWKMFNMAVTYLDPFNSQEEEHIPFPFFTKNFKYAYQFEYRLVWLPLYSTFKEKIDHLFLNIGSIKDISELIIL
ncbi:MAG: hypothetical protein ABIH85_03675 [Candidatus Omnitrophota bacterium]